MQKLFDFRAVSAENYPQLISLFKTVFNDSDESVNNFFRNTVTPENTLAVFNGEEVVSELFLVDSVITVAGTEYPAFYVYGVCTNPDYRGQGLMTMLLNEAEILAEKRGVKYLFLVPEGEKLFNMYGKLGYKTGFFYKEELVNADASANVFSKELLTYPVYKKLRKEFYNGSTATLGEKGFDSFMKPSCNDVQIIYGKDAGYCVAENDGKGVIIHELCGDKQMLVDAVGKAYNCSRFLLRTAAVLGGVPFGMYKNIDNSPEITNGFFGIPYGV